MNEHWQEVIDELRGTCNLSQSDEHEELFDDLDFCAELDSQIFSCTQCGWWCDIDEEVSDDYGLDDLTCRDCVDG